MKRNLFISCLLLLLAACADPKQEAHAHEEHEEHAEHEETNTATLTAEQIASVGIETGSIEQKQLTASVKANGMLQVPNQNKASISPLYSGMIKSLLVQPGSPVNKGQPIATIVNPEFIQAQEDYLGVNARVALAELEYSRQKELNEGNAGVLKNLQAADAELRGLRARKTSLEAQLQLMGLNPAKVSQQHLASVLTVTSPIKGVVSSVLMKTGSYVSPGSSIAEIVDNSQLHLDLYVYEKDLSRLREQQTIHFTLTNNPGKEYDATIFSLGSSFEGESKAVSVHARVEGDKAGLIDGMNITAIISLEKATVPAVPTAAIVRHQGQDFIFLAKDDHFERIPVARGTTDIGYTEITLLKEVPADAKIVVKGAFFVLAKMTNAGEAHEH
ncbi:efflux RND transporter periplasmic adaptor subunit [Chitinophaga horti]|uniref:Efflux RND transporter periplasmic adaptor subunit n=1 Tax=Chitinophaga horti TaxID=2920382 RepID=A0ABY6J6W3_9BACT|nr:efflux RND transporter periplasmic adaptor subunit [Chitinophaga horti]UYQ95433.1 efflux RND transporter periplasmic adaptor subunit [Chitinophaga horti]